MELGSTSPSPQSGNASPSPTLKGEGQVIGLRNEAGRPIATVQTAQGKFDIPVSNSVSMGQKLLIEGHSTGANSASGGNGANGQMTWSVAPGLDSFSPSDSLPNAGLQNQSGVRVENGIGALTEFRNQLLKWLSLQNPEKGRLGESQLPPDLHKSLAEYLNQEGVLNPSLALNKNAIDVSAIPLSQANLESLLLKVLSTSGGEAKVLLGLRQLPPPVALGLTKATLDSLQPAPENDVSTRNFLQLLIRSLDKGATPGLRKTSLPSEVARPLTGMARIVEREWMGDLAAGVDISRSLQNVAAGSPLLRLQLWSSGRSLPMLAPDSPLVGHPVDFTYAEANGLRGMVSARGSTSGASLSAVLEQAYGLANPERRLALAAAQDVLADIEKAPFYARAVQDFAAIIEATGWMRAPASNESQPFQPAIRPELESLLKLWLEKEPAAGDSSEAGLSRAVAEKTGNPTQIGTQEKSSALSLAPGWAEAIRNPETLLKVLQWLKPTPIDMPGSALPSPFLQSQTTLSPAHPEASALFRNVLGEPLAARVEHGLSLEAWSQLERRADANSSGVGSQAAKWDAFQSAVQVLTHQVKSDSMNGLGQPATVYFFQPPQWHALQVERELQTDEKKQKQSSRKNGGWKASVDWTGDFLGNALACVRLVEGGIDLELKHEGPNAQDILQQEIPRLEAALAQMGLELKAWSYLHQPHSSTKSNPETPRLPSLPPHQQLDFRI